MEVITKNKKAYFEYEVLDPKLAGVKLTGTEVKSIKGGKVSVAEAYCFINNEELFIKGMNVSEWNGSDEKHVPVRDRKLLMKKKEILKFASLIKEKGLTIVPLAILVTTTGLIKVELSLCKGKKVYDKRASIKAKDIKRETDRLLNK